MTMSESADEVFNSEPERLAEFFKLGARPQRLWRSDELDAILRHQLAAPVFFDLEAFEPEKAAQLRAALAGEGTTGPIQSFSDLLHLWHPPLELLRLTKDFAKSHLGHLDATLPREVATVLYYASILVARMRCAEFLTRLNEEALLKGVRWVLDQPWLDPETRALFQEGERRMRGGNGPAG